MKATQTPKIKKNLDPDAPRSTDLKCRVNEYEKETAKAMIAEITPHAAAIHAKRIAEALTHNAPFATVGDFLRTVLGLPDIHVGAPAGNQNHTGKRGGNHHTAKSRR